MLMKSEGAFEYAKIIFDKCLAYYAVMTFFYRMASAFVPSEKTAQTEMNSYKAVPISDTPSPSTTEPAQAASRVRIEP